MRYSRISRYVIRQSVGFTRIYAYTYFAASASRFPVETFFQVTRFRTKWRESRVRKTLKRIETGARVHTAFEPIDLSEIRATQRVYIFRRASSRNAVHIFLILLCNSYSWIRLRGSSKCRRMPGAMSKRKCLVKYFSRRAWIFHSAEEWREEIAERVLPLHDDSVAREKNKIYLPW